MSEDIYYGWHGEYDLAQGYFDCFNMDTLKTREDFRAHITKMQDSGYIQDSTRSVILSMTIYDIPTRFYTNIVLGLEISAAGFYNPNILEIHPFTVPFKDS